ncbi:B12-binding domain-containing protein [Actinomadura viridis]|uniref:cobalamin B12-binding domain-containing protein n=1 Tax=Actinomadura viridis TaxID=58110 RepID=UPI00369D1304
MSPPAIGAGVYDAFFAALSHADADAAIRIATGLADAGVPVPDLLALLVAPAQRQVGAFWADNSWNVAREHAATHISTQVVAALGVRLRTPDPPRGRVVMACVDGDWHALAAQIAGETLRAEGWAVTTLGASTPAEHMAHFVHEVGPDAAGLSCMVPLNLPQARSMIEAVRHTGVPVLAGGPGFGPDGRWARRLGADVWVPDPATAVERLSCGWPAFTDPAPDLDYLTDDEHERLEAERPMLVGRAMSVLTGSREAAGYSPRQLQRTGEDLAHIVDFLIAALLVDDVTLLESFTRWLARILRPRGVPRQALAAGYEILGADLTGYPRARDMLARAGALLTPVDSRT